MNAVTSPGSSASLRPSDVAMFDRFGISVEWLDAAGIKRVTDAEARADCGIRYRSPHLAGIWYPNVDPERGTVRGGRLRRDHPELSPDQRPIAKYVGPPDRHALYFPPGAGASLVDGAVSVVIVEAEKSALALTAAACRANRPLLAVATGGCWGWRGTVGKVTTVHGARVDEKGPLADLDRLAWVDRDVVVMFDANAATNSRVSAARQALAADLRRRGARLRLAELPVEAGINGPDDVRAEHGDAALFALLDVAAPVGSMTVADEWPTLTPIQGELPPVDAFSEDLLPVSFRPLVQDVTTRMQVPMDYPAIVMMLCLAGAVNRRASIQPKALDTGWVVTPNLWGGLVAPPGFLKSPVIQAVTRPLHQIQAQWRDDHDAAQEEYGRAQEEQVIRHTAWKEEFKKRTKRGEPPPDRPNDAIDAPRMRRLIVNDATFEALHQTMSENPAGILVIRDELTGWWSQLDRSGREGERAFCLQAWNGDTGHTIDRIGRGTIHVDACCLSMLGGIQPGRLRSYLVDALEDGPSNDGLIQRFQLLVWPDVRPAWRYVDRAPDARSEDLAARVFRRLVELDEQRPARFVFAPDDAQPLFIAWLTELEARIRADDLPPVLVCHLAKYRKLMPALALLFELADRASSEGFDGAALAHAPNCVSLEHARQAAACCEYLESHARRVYSCVVTPQLRAARALAERIRKRALGTAFSCRDVYLKGWTDLGTPDAVRLATDRLIDAGWIRRVRLDAGSLGGRPSERFDVNPTAWT